MYKNSKVGRVNRTSGRAGGRKRTVSREAERRLDGGRGAGRGLPPLSRVPAAARNRVESFRAAPTHLRPPYSTQFPKRSIPTSPSPRAACCTKNPLPGARGRHCPRRQGNIAFTFGRSRKKAPSRVRPSEQRPSHLRRRRLREPEGPFLSPPFSSPSVFCLAPPTLPTLHSAPASANRCE